MKTLRIGVVQLCSTADVDANLAALSRELERCADRGATLIFTPENTGWLRIGDVPTPCHNLETCPTVTCCRQFARRRGVSILLGSTLLSEDGVAGKATNTSLLIDAAGEIHARYDKLHLFSVDLGPDTRFDESNHIRSGTTPACADFEGLRIGMSICYDLRFPELYRNYAASGCSLLSIPAAFTERTGRDHWEPLLRARAIENQCFVVAAAQWGHHGGKRTSYGHSMVVDPWGIVVAQAADGVGSLVVDLDFSRLQQIRASLPCLQHRRPI